MTTPSPFSKYLFQDVPRIVANPTDPEDLAIVDQLLVSAHAAANVVAWLAVPDNVKKYVTRPQAKTLAAGVGVKATLLTTVFHNLSNSHNIEDINIYALTLTSGNALPHGLTVFDVTQALRNAADKKVKTLTSLQNDQASPNHVLVPSAFEWCPYGPPSPDPGPSLAAPGGAAGAKVTVVDAGHIWASSWGTNPLDEMVDGGTLLPPVEADFLEITSLNPPAAHWHHPGIPNTPSTHAPGVLDAVAGHANFVAGVVAQHAFQPEIHIWDHSSAYQPPPAPPHIGDNFPTEASVCRSIYMSQLAVQTPVINCGFATTVYQDIPSDVWNKLFARIENNLNVDLSENLVFTAPAGNEGFVSVTEATRPHFPAALHLTIPKVGKITKFVPFQVVGVASLNPLQPWTASGFSDYGSWVTASAIGEDVVSTFLHVDMATQQNPSAGKQDFTSNYALWNGTSFAAPKVAGAVAARIAAGGSGMTAKAAWNALSSVYGTTANATGANNGLGTMFENL